MSERIRLDAPDAAEKAAALFVRAVYQNQALSSWPEHSRTPMLKGARAVLDAIEQPRLPTRSQVVERLTKYTSDGDQLRRLQLSVLVLADDLIEAGWATEDPEPEIDERQVGELAKLLALANGSAWPTPHPGDGPVYREQAAALLAAGVRLPAQVTP